MAAMPERAAMRPRRVNPKGFDVDSFLTGMVEWVLNVSLSAVVMANKEGSAKGYKKEEAGRSRCFRERPAVERFRGLTNL